MIAWFGAHVGAFGTAVRRLARHPLATFFEVLVLGIALSLPVGLFLVVETARGFAGRLPSEPEISVFLERNTGSEAIATLARKLRTLPDVREVQFVSREDAAERLREAVGMKEMLEALPENPLPDAFTLRLGQQDASRMESLKTAISKWQGVEVVQADSGWTRKVETSLRVGHSGVVLLGILFGLGALTVTFNTIRLQMSGRRDEIQLARLIGATDAYIRRPFVYFGAIQGLLGGTAAIGILAAAHYFLVEPLSSFSTAYGLQIGLPATPFPWIAGFLLTTAFLGAAAAGAAAMRHLWARDVRPHGPY